MDDDTLDAAYTAVEALMDEAWDEDYDPAAWAPIKACIKVYDVDGARAAYRNLSADDRSLIGLVGDDDDSPGATELRRTLGIKNAD